MWYNFDTLILMFFPDLLSKQYMCHLTYEALPTNKDVFFYFDTFQWLKMCFLKTMIDTQNIIRIY